MARNRAGFQGQATQTVVSVGSSILRALMGRKLASSTNVRGATTAARAAARASRQHGDIDRAQRALDALLQRRDELDRQLAAAVAKLEQGATEVEVVEYPVRPRKSDIVVQKVVLAWVPRAE